MARIAREKEVAGTGPTANPVAVAPWLAWRSSTNLSYYPLFDESETWGKEGTTTDSPRVTSVAEKEQDRRGAG